VAIPCGSHSAHARPRRSVTHEPPPVVCHGIDGHHHRPMCFTRRTRACLTDLQDYTGSCPHLVIQGRSGMMTPREPKRAISKILVNRPKPNEPVTGGKKASEGAKT
jgi:hypothetical protein